MKFLLVAINAKYIHSNPAVYSLKAYAEKNHFSSAGPEIEIAEYTINQNLDEIESGIIEKQPDFVGFSCYIWNIETVMRVISDIGKLLPQVKIWLGGPEVSFCPERFLGPFSFVTGIMLGEGEKTFTNLVNVYSDHRNADEELAALPGVLLYGTRPAEFNAANVCSLDELPFLYNEENIDRFKNRIIYYESSRGCPYRCSYCLSSLEKNLRFKSFSKVREELLFFLKHKVPQVKFIDRTFNASKEHALKIWEFISENDNGVTNFHFEIAGEILTDEEISVLQKMRPGLVQLEIGVQSSNLDTLKEIRRTCDLEKLKDRINEVRNLRNMHIHLDLIAGLPFEGLESFKKSYGFIYGLRPDELQLGFLKVLKGTYISEKAEDYGLKSHDFPPYEVLETKWLSYGDICELKKVEEMTEIYYNSGQFTETLKTIEASFENPYEMMKCLADFYRTRGLFVNQPSRSYRYTAILEFVRGNFPEKEDIVREAMTYDFYRREKAKSRPDFSKDLSGYADFLREAYKRYGKEVHIDVFSYAFPAEGTATRLKAPQPVVFDYSVRSPIDNNAAVKYIEFL